jgi:hypothetical protein
MQDYANKDYLKQGFKHWCALRYFLGSLVLVFIFGVIGGLDARDKELSNEQAKLSIRLAKIEAAEIEKERVFDLHVKQGAYMTGIDAEKQHIEK